MKKREFLKTTGLIAFGTAVGGSLLASCNNENPQKEDKEDQNKEVSVVSAFELPALEYGFDALAPNIDARTMEIHHGKHHAGYVKKLNKALEGHALAGKSLEEIITSVSDKEADLGVRNNGGGHFNHSMFWKIMGPNAGGNPEGKIAEAINESFDSFENFTNEFKTAAGSLFGSGWCWLCLNADKKLFITTTPNQDNPLMKDLAEEPGTPIMGLDVWEHAYYLNYQNKRKEYINNFFNVIRWDRVEENLQNALG
jgi:Fe-Mn family superoxide dismutase